MANDLRLQVLLQTLDKASRPLRHIDQASRDTTNALRDTRSSLKALEGQQQKLSSFRALKNATEQSSNALQSAKQHAAALRRELDATDTPTRKVTTAYNKATRQVDKLTHAHTDNLQALRSQRRELNDAGISAKNFGNAERDLKAKIDRTTASIGVQGKAITSLHNQQQRLAAIERSRAQIGGKLMGAVGTAAIAGYALSRVIGPANEFDYQLQLIGNTADMTGNQVEVLRGKILAASKATGQSAPTVEKALGFLIAAGQSTDVASRSIVAIGRTSTAAGADIEDVSRAAFTLTDALNVKPEGLQKALDILAQAGKEGNVELRDMAKQLPVLGAGFRSFKMQGNEATATLAAALEIARKGAADPDEAANNMRNYMAKVLSPTTLKKAQSAFGLDLYKVIQDAQTSGGNPFEASIEAVMKATGGDQKKLGELFQDMQVQNFLKPVMQNWAEYQRIKAKSLAATGVTDRDFAKIMGVAKQQLANVASAAGRLGLAFNHTLFPALGRTASAIAPVLDRMAQFVDKHPRLVAGITKIVAGLVAMRLALLGVRYGWTFIGGGLAQRSIAQLRKTMAAHAAEKLGAAGAPAMARSGLGALPAIGAAISAISLPVILVGAAIAAVALLVWKYWGPIKAFFIGIGKGLSETLGPAFKAIGTALSPLKPLWDRIVGSLQSVWIWAKQLLQPFHATDEQLKGATTTGQRFGAVMGGVLGGVVQAISFGVKAFVWLGTTIGDIIGWVVVHARKVIDFFSTAWPKVTEAIKAPFTAAFEWIGGKIDAFMAKWNWLRGKLGMHSDSGSTALQWNTGDGNNPVAPANFYKPIKAGGGGNTFTSTNHITVHAAPGHEESAAKAVSAELDRRERAKAAAQRSRLADTD